MVNLWWEGKSNQFAKIKDSIKKNVNLFEEINANSINKPTTVQKSSDKVVWRNKLFWADNLEVLYYLMKDFKEKIDLIYIDPPFFSGTNYQIKIEEKERFYETIAYYDCWEKDLDSYLQMLYERIILFKRLLSEKGLLFIHLDWHAIHYVKLILDEVFGQDKFVNNIIWYYYNKYSTGKKTIPRAHDDILVYSKSANYRLNEIRIPRDKPIKQLKREMVDGVLKNVKDKDGHVVYRTVKDKKLDDVWKIPCLQPASKEWTGFPTQKHHRLLERIIRLGSNEGDLIADFFCGSGTTLMVAEKLKRKWIGSDISEYAIYLTQKRLIEYQNKSSDSFNTFNIYTILTEDREKLINSGFFKKKLQIERKR